MKRRIPKPMHEALAEIYHRVLGEPVPERLRRTLDDLGEKSPT